MQLPPGKLPLVEPRVQAPVSLGVEFKSFRKSAVSPVLLGHSGMGSMEREGADLTRFLLG